MGFSLNIGKYIELKYFLIAFFVGMLITYITVPAPEVIYKYPTPDNAGKVLYQDSADVCYVYEAEEVECPSDKKIIKKFDIQHVDQEDKNKQGFLNNVQKLVSHYTNH